LTSEDKRSCSRKHLESDVMAAVSAYRIDNQAVHEEHKPTSPGEVAELRRPFSERLHENMRIVILER